MRWIVACQFLSARVRRPILGAPTSERESLTALPVALLLAVSAPAIAQSPTQQGQAPIAAPGGISISPKNGQSQQQQAADRYACHSWAKNQTGFDPTLPNGGVSPNLEAPRRAEYRRAIAACLEGRGYGVQYAAPPPPARVYAAPPASVYAVPPSPAPNAYAAPPRVVNYSPAEPELKYQPFQAQIDGGYTVTTGNTKEALNNGSNVGLGFTWFPTSALPVGIRVDGSYSSFAAAGPLLNMNGTQFTNGHANLYGGDADLQLDLAHRSSRQKLYLFGGFGWYREQTRLRQISIAKGTACGFFYCGPGYFPALTAVDETTSPWLKSWNAGLGWEVAVADHASFFMEARFQHFLQNSGDMQFVPITVGLRF